MQARQYIPKKADTRRVPILGTALDSTLFVYNIHVGLGNAYTIAEQCYHQRGNIRELVFS